MWFGDSVTLTPWPDIWLHEGFATWSEWIWSEHEGNKSARAVLRAALQHAAAGHRVLDAAGRAIPGTPALLFDGTIYDRGAMTLEALREKIGDTRSSGSCATGPRRTATATSRRAQFIALAEQESGMDLDHFFDVWLYDPEQADVLVGHSTRGLRRTQGASCRLS